MKKKTNLFQKNFLASTVAILMVVAVNLSCKKNEQVMRSVPNFDKLSNDDNFVDLVKLDLAFLNNIKNLSAAVDLINDKKEDQASLLALAKHLGFNEISDYRELIIKQEKLKTQLRNKFQFESLTAEENLIIKTRVTSFIVNDLKIVNGLKPNSLSVVDGSGGGDGAPTCSSIRSDCQAASSAIYVMEGLACIGGAAAVGSGTFGVGGALFYAACTSASLVHYNSMLNDCQSGWYSCMGVPPIRE